MLYSLLQLLNISSIVLLAAIWTHVCTLLALSVTHLALLYIKLLIQYHHLSTLTVLVSYRLPSIAPNITMPTEHGLTEQIEASTRILQRCTDTARASGNRKGIQDAQIELDLEKTNRKRNAANKALKAPKSKPVPIPGAPSPPTKT